MMGLQEALVQALENLYYAALNSDSADKMTGELAEAATALYRAGVRLDP